MNFYDLEDNSNWLQCIQIQNNEKENFNFDINKANEKEDFKKKAS